MNAFVAAASAAFASTVFWHIAADAAGRRSQTIGTLPRLLPLACALAAGAAALEGAHVAAISAVAAVAVAGVADARTGSIFDPLSLALAATALALAVLDDSVRDGVAGAMAAGGGLLLLYAATGGRGIGLGDVKLSIGLGFALGFASGIAALALAFVFGGVYGSWLLATKRVAAGTPVRFAPFMAGGTLAALLITPCMHR